MNKYVLFVVRIVAMLISVAAFNLIIGVCGLKWAIFTTVIVIIFTIYTCFCARPEKEDPYA